MQLVYFPSIASVRWVKIFNQDGLKEKRTVIGSNSSLLPLVSACSGAWHGRGVLACALVDAEGAPS